MGVCKSLSSLRSFISYSPGLLEPISCVCNILNFLVAYCKEWLQSDGWYFSPLKVPSGHTSLHWIVANTDDCDILVY